MGLFNDVPAELEALPQYERRTAVVHTRDGNSLQGVLVGAYDDAVVLRHATDLDSTEQLKGDIIVPRPNVSYLQVLESE